LEDNIKMDLIGWQGEGCLDITQGRAVFIDFFFGAAGRIRVRAGVVSPGVRNRQMGKIKTKRRNECDI
jgi:hypothetical protein